VDKRRIPSRLMDDTVIETEQSVHAQAVATVVRRAFAHHPGVDTMVAAIRRSPRYRPDLAFVARAGKQVVGFVMLSGTDLVNREAGVRREVLTLTPLAVDPDYQGRGIGAALVRAALQAADLSGEPLVVLEGSPHYYGRIGFRYAVDHGITIDLPEWVLPAAAQVFLLRAHDPGMQGHVEYPPAIAEMSS
jgi:putative acetyltransferase